MEKIRILVYFVLAYTPICWNCINNYYTYWLSIPCQSVVPKASCNFYNSDDTWVCTIQENLELKWFSHIHTEAEIISLSLPNSKACTQTLLPSIGSKMRENLKNEMCKYVCLSLCVQDCTDWPLWVSEPCYPFSPFLGQNLYMVFTICREPTHETPPMTRSWGRNLTGKANQVFRGFEKASSRDPTHDKVTRRKPDRQGRPGSQGFRKAAPAITLKMISVCLTPALIDYSLISLTQAEGLPRSLPK